MVKSLELLCYTHIHTYKIQAHIYNHVCVCVCKVHVRTHLHVGCAVACARFCVYVRACVHRYQLNYSEFNMVRTCPPSPVRRCVDLTSQRRPIISLKSVSAPYRMCCCECGCAGVSLNTYIIVSAPPLLSVVANPPPPLPL